MASARPKPPVGVVGGRDLRTRAVEALRSPRVQTALATLLYLAYAIFLLWPAVTDLDSTVSGAPGDLTGAIAKYREMIQHGIVPFFPDQSIPDWNAPEGQPVDWRVYLAAWPSTLLTYGLALVFGPVAGFTLFTWIGYVGSAIAMFLLTRRLTGRPGIALLAGWAFAFFPFVAMKGGGHNDFVHNWVFVVMVWRLLVLYERPTMRSGVWAALAAILAVSWTPYYFLFAGVVFATLVAGQAVMAAVRHEVRARVPVLAATSALVAVYVAVLYAVTVLTESSGAVLRTHGIDALYVYGARLHEYLVPPRGTILFGDSTTPYLTERLHGSNFSEATLYVGITLILLALVGLVSALRERRRDPRTALLAAAFALVAVIGFAFSAPPKVDLGPVTVATPSQYVFEITSTWRVYSRFVIVVMLALCPLAAFGLARIGRSRTPVALGLVAILSAVVLVDLYTRPGGGVGTKLEAPAVAALLKKQPPGLAAHYPLLPEGVGNYTELFIQDDHDKPVINGYGGTPQEGRDLALANLADPKTPGRLRSLGVRYVIVPDEPVSPPVVNPGKPRPDQARLIGTAGYYTTTARLYEITAPPIPLLTGIDGFLSVEPDGGQWLGADDGTIEVRYPCRTCTGELSMHLSSLVPQRVSITSDAGRTLWSATVEPGVDRRVAIPLRFENRVNLTLHTSPGAGQIPGPDPRDVSVRMTKLRFRPASG